MEIIKEIVNEELGTKFVIYKKENGYYSYSYWEMCGGKWSPINKDETNYTQDVIETEFGIKLYEEIA